MMKTHTHILFFCLSFLPISGIHAQVALPYYSGFDNTAERAGWQIYRTAENAIANWSIPSVGGFSPNSCISHDYAPSSGATIADDWYVSPGFLLPAGGTLDSVRYSFSGFSVPADEDTIGVFLLTGSQDPENATSITLLADFRGASYQTDNMYRLLSGIDLPPSTETCHIAIRYLNTHVSSWWLAVRFDNIAISDMSTSTEEGTSESLISVYPNPCSDILHIHHPGQNPEITVYDIFGKRIQVDELSLSQNVGSISTGHLPSGMFQIRIQDEGKFRTTLFLKK